MCAQLYVQRNAQPDTWVMSGAPTATTVFLSLDATINYSDGTSDTLPANTLAVLPDTTTVFDRTHDVFVCYTVQASRVLSVIKESLLPTLTSAYAPLCRIEMHGIKPYQPEPYLASGGAGAGTPTTTVAQAAVGLGLVLDVGAGGTPPATWQTAGYDDSAWAAPLAEDVHTIGSPLGSSGWITPVVAFDATTPGKVWLHRLRFVLPTGPVTSASLQIWADNFVDAVYVNGTATSGAPSGGWFTGATPAVLSVPLGALLPGGSNLLAIAVRNATPAQGENLGTGLARSSLDYVLTIGQNAAGGVSDPGGHEGDLLYYHSGAWTDLPVGTSGQELTVVGGDPAWTDQPAGGGTVTSVALTMPAEFSVGGSPVTGAGTLAVSKATQAAHSVYAGPSSGSAAPTFRALAAADLPAAPGAGGNVHAHGHFL